jgi:nitrile hydratase
MDGIHDLGGLQGFGPVKALDQDAPIKHDWEARVWGINKTITADPSWTLDFWRHVRELIAPQDYLTRPYFDQWAQIYMALLIDSGHCSLEEIKNGKSSGPRPNLGPPMSAAEVADKLGRADSFARPLDQPPAFAPGQAVRTMAKGSAGHTRLPRYARGKTGTIQAHHGAHLFADASAKGKAQPAHLYSVAFAAADLWPEAQESRDKVFLDLWEPYLESA